MHHEYNPFSFENYRILKTISDGGHEIGFLGEIIDEVAIGDEDAAKCLNRVTLRFLMKCLVFI